MIGRIKANRIVSGLQERILLAQKRRIIGQSTTFRDRRIQESIMGLYPVKYEKGVTDEANYIYYGKKITVSEIPQQVCEALKDDETLKGTLSEVRGIVSFNDGGEDGTCKEENNEFFVLFGGRSEGKCRGVNNGCLECDDRTGEWVIDEAKDGEQIHDICHKCSNGHVVAKEKGKVIPCGNECCAMFEKCDTTYGCVPQCPANSSTEVIPGNQIGNTDCYCNEGYRVDAFQTGCRSEKICDPTCESPLVCDDGDCVCPNEGDVYAPHFDTGGEMICCPAENIVDGYCCDNPKGDGTCCASDGTACCPISHPLMTTDGICRTCDDTTYNTVVTKTTDISSNCARCPNRKLISSWYKNEYCSVKKCPTETPLQNYQGKCLSCKVSEPQYMSDPDNGNGYNNSCSACLNRGETGYKGGHGYQCSICPGDSFVDENGRCACPPEKPLLGQDGCHTCYENVAIVSFKGDGSSFCGVCLNRMEFPDCCRGESYCGLTQCDTDQIHDHKGVCHDCSTSNRIRIKSPNGNYYSPDTCSMCNGQRYTVEDGSVIYCNKCPTDKSTLTETQCAECLGSWDGTVCH